MTGNRFFSALITLLIVLPVFIFAQDLNIKVSIPATEVGVGQAFNYTVELSGSRMQLPNLTTAPDFSGFKVISGPNVSTSISMVNFKTTAKKIYTWSLLPRKIGKHTILPPEVKEGAKVHKGNPVTVNVKEQANPNLGRSSARGGQQTGAAFNIADHVFMKTVASKLNPFRGEQVIIEYKIYFDINISSPGLESNEYQDFWVEEFDRGTQLSVSNEKFNGKVYQVTTIKKIAVYPAKSGKLLVPQLVLSLDAVIPSQRQRSRSMFENFFDSPFGRRERITVSSSRLKLNVKPLPKIGKPIDYSGLVGRFTFTGGIDKDSAKVNEAVTYNLKLRGKGNLYLVSEPKINYSNEFEDYPGSLKKTIDWAKYDNGTVKWEQVLIPRAPGKLEIPAYTINWFDTVKGKYQSKTIGPLYLNVAGDARRYYAGDASPINRQSVESISSDIRYLKSATSFYARGTTFWYNWKFFLFLAIGLLMILTILLTDNYREKLATNLSWQRQKNAGKVANKRLRETKKRLGNDDDRFFHELEKGIYGFFADRLNLPVASVGREKVELILKEINVDTDLNNIIIDILKTSELRRYAPGTSDLAERADLYEKSVTALSQLVRSVK